MKNLKDTILEKLRVDDIRFDEFPVDGTIEEITEFLKSHNFIRINKKMKLWTDVIKVFMNKSGKLFILEDLRNDDEYIFSLKLINTQNRAYHDTFFLYNLKRTHEKDFRICKIENVYTTRDEHVEEGKFLNEVNKIL